MGGCDFERGRYSDATTLSVFLPTLSYHRIGARVFGDAIVASRPPAGWSLLDIGCGEGMFTAAQLSALTPRVEFPSVVYAIDPDRHNLSLHRKQLTERFGVEVKAVEAGLEDCYRVLPRCHVVLASHSLYGLLENPAIPAQVKRECVAALVRARRKRGVTLISMASRDSPAYTYKRAVLQLLGVPDRSRFGQDVVWTLGALGVEYRHEIDDSYMDVTRLLQEGEALVAWIMYFCRVTQNQLEEVGTRRLTDELAKFAEPFAGLPEGLRAKFACAPAKVGPPTAETMILRHRECFIRVA